MPSRGSAGLALWRVMWHRPSLQPLLSHAGGARVTPASPGRVPRGVAGLSRADVNRILANTLQGPVRRGSPRPHPPPRAALTFVLSSSTASLSCCRAGGVSTREEARSKSAQGHRWLSVFRAKYLATAHQEKASHTDCQHKSFPGGGVPGFW